MSVPLRAFTVIIFSSGEWRVHRQADRYITHQTRRWIEKAEGYIHIFIKNTIIFSNDVFCLSDWQGWRYSRTSRMLECHHYHYITAVCVRWTCLAKFLTKGINTFGRFLAAEVYQSWNIYRGKVSIWMIVCWHHKEQLLSENNIHWHLHLFTFVKQVLFWMSEDNNVIK